MTLCSIWRTDNVGQTLLLLDPYAMLLNPFPPPPHTSPLLSPLFLPYIVLPVYVALPLCLFWIVTLQWSQAQTQSDDLFVTFCYNDFCWNLGGGGGGGIFCWCYFHTLICYVLGASFMVEAQGLTCSLGRCWGARVDSWALVHHAQAPFCQHGHVLHMWVCSPPQPRPQ